jgi:hypothetical protein
MRLVFWLLLLVNLGLIVGARGYFTQTEAGHEPERLERQISPAQLRILSGEMAILAPPPPAKSASPMLACKRISGLSPVEADSLAAALNGLANWQITVAQVETASAYRILIPGLSSRPVADKKREELRLLGISEHQVAEHATHGPFTVLFTQHPDEPAASEALQKLQRKGVRSARIVTEAVPAQRVAEVRAPETLLMQKLPDLAALFPTASIGNCMAP